MTVYLTLRLLYGFIIVNIHINICFMQTSQDNGVETEATNGDTGHVAGVHEQMSSSHQVCQPNVFVAPVINCSTSDILKEANHLRQEVTLLNERVHRLTEHIGSALPGRYA